MSSDHNSSLGRAHGHCDGESTPIYKKKFGLVTNKSAWASFKEISSPFFSSGSFVFFISDSDESTASATASTTDSSSNTVYDTSSLQGNVQLEKTEKSESTEKQGDEGDNDDEAIDWEEYHQQSQSSFTSTDEYDEPEHVFDGNPLMNMMSLNNYSMARIRIHTKYSLKRGSSVLYSS